MAMREGVGGGGGIRASDPLPLSQHKRALRQCSRTFSSHSLPAFRVAPPRGAVSEKGRERVDGEAASQPSLSLSHGGASRCRCRRSTNVLFCFCWFSRGWGWLLVEVLVRPSSPLRGPSMVRADDNDVPCLMVLNERCATKCATQFGITALVEN